MIVGGRSLWDLAEDRAAEITRLRARVAVLERVAEEASHFRRPPCACSWTADDDVVGLCGAHQEFVDSKLAAAERDAARYRYMRDDGYGVTIDVLEYDDDGGEDWVSGYSPADLDEAIDRLMQPHAGGEGGQS